MDRPDIFDCAIIGGGVTGCAAARLLSKYGLSLALVEAAEDVSMGASRANSGIVHAGYDAAPGSAMARLNARGNAMFDQWCGELGVPLVRCGSLALAFDETDQRSLEELYESGLANGVPGMELVSGGEARALEPLVNPDVIQALWAPTAGITSPYQLTIGCWENARANGLATFFDTRVASVERGDGHFILNADSGSSVRARYVVNAAGLYADEVARLFGDQSFSIKPRKGEYILLDKDGSAPKRVLFQAPSVMGKGVLVSPTADGNAFAGPTALDQTDKSDTSTTGEGAAELRRLALRSAPGLNLRAAITAFSGLRAVGSTGDFIIRASGIEPRLIHAAGIASPGLTSAPAIAEEIVNILANQGLRLKAKPDWNPIREPIERFAGMTRERQAEVIASDPRWGHVVCRCETVTEGEIVEAIRRGARSLDGVKRRVRAGMGRCQGGFCAPRVMETLARERGVSMDSITKFGGGSRMLVGPIRESVGGRAVEGEARA
ncbi:MAG: NAD(P)/FAD-dependent oxidoreductase [Oscillospiraceae bacterium]|nr:NAD(P)/FAD-dependent oxidoreductase [Oscillospiraceae bacterium]